MHRFVLTVWLVALATGQQEQQGQQGQQGKKGDDDPCKNYASITDEKRSIKYRATGGERNICDKDNIDEKVWYRFQTLPPQRIHDQCVEELKCGTEQPVWISGTHPTAVDPGPKEVDICSPQGNDCCGGWREKIRVKFCRDPAGGDNFFFVYLLKKVPRCDMAYCAGDGAVCATGTAWNPNSKTCTEPHPNIAEPVFGGPTIVKKKLMDKHPYDDFYFSCNIKWTNPDTVKKEEQFEVAFTFDGKEEASVPPKITDGSNLDVKLWSKEIKGHVGKTVGCKVRSYWKMVEGRRSRHYVSQGNYYVGIRYSTTNAAGSFTSPPIHIEEGSPPLTIYFQATVPISCPETTTFMTSCKVTVVMSDIAKKDDFGLRECSIIFAGLDFDKGFPVQMIQALTTPGIMNRASVLRFRPIDYTESFWHQYQLLDIPIIIKDKSTTGICSSLGDPHITTFDQRYYHCYTEGDYLLAKSTERNFEVHVRHHKYGDATVNCAVAVREGNNVIGINFCGGPHTFPSTMTYLRDSKVPGATITLTGNRYIITMPSGAYLIADYHRGGLNSYLNVYLYLNSEDKGKTSGLCGTWNGNPGDDNVPKGTTTNDARDWPVTFSNSYRLKPEESFINGHVRPINCLNTKDLLPNICTCDEKRSVTCNAPDPKTTTYVSQFAENCNGKQIPPNRKRRAADSMNGTMEVENRTSDMILTEADIPIPTVDEEHGVNFTPRWPTASGITKEQAERYCQTKMESSPVYQTCKDQIATEAKTVVSGCVEDAQVMDNLTVASASIATQFQRLCVHKLEISVVSNGSSTPTAEETLLSNVMSMICPDQCNGNGNCRNGACVCNSGFGGEDCSVNTLNPPRMERFRRDVKCDFRSSYCQETSIFASNFFHSDKFSCKITAVDHSKQFTLGGSLLSNGEVVCRLPAVYKFTDETSQGHGPAKDVGPAAFYRWDISITNDGSRYSNSLRLTVFDSKCQEIRPDGTTTQKAETCLIGGRCYVSGDVSRLNRCKKCFPSRSRDNWSHDETEKVCPSSAASLNYSISIFVAAIVISFLRINV